MTPFRLLHLMMLAASAAAMLLTGPTAARGDEVDLHRLLHGPERCDHVLPLLMRYGVNNSCGDASTLPTHHPFGSVAIPAAELGDLQLVSIARHADPAAGCGPAFDLVIKNCSTRDVCGARVTLVALFGRLRPTSPSVTVKVDSLPAGQAMQICVTLPLESLAMGHYNGQAISFNQVLVVLDSFDQFMEADEANNLRLFDASTIPVATAVVAEETNQTLSVDTAQGTPVQGGAVQGGAVQGGAVQGGAVQGEAVQGGQGQTPAAQAPAGTPTTGTAPNPSSDASQQLSSPDLRSAINQFTNEATTEQDAS